MRELEYPFDAGFIVTQKKKIKRRLLEQIKDTHSSCIPTRVAVLGGGTTTDVKDCIELFLLHCGIEPVFYESEYNRYYQDAVFSNDELDSFHPDFVYICTSNHNITEYPAITDSSEYIDGLVSNEISKFTAIWDALFQRFHCVIIQNNFDMPYLRPLGNREAWDIHGGVHFLSRINMAFAEYAQTHEGLYICDLNWISSDYGLKEWADPYFWYMYKYAMALEAIPYLSYNVANIIKSLLGKNMKAIVTDLDNTLWGGVIGDDGVENISLGSEGSKDQAYQAFQRYLKRLQTQGILLNIDSKNDYENALAGLEHPDSILKKDDFIDIRANWDPKDTNFLEIAKTLNLLPESMVFIDDNPAERHIVREQIPGAKVPELTEISYFAATVDRSGFFEVTNFSADDLDRNIMYQDNAKRARFEKTFSDYGEYLLSLEMKAKIRPFESLYLARIAQLTNKSNQFNLTTRRYTREEIEIVSEDPQYITLYGKLEDRFGDNGVVSVLIAHCGDDKCQVDLWLMSCRVLKRDMECAMMDALVSECKKRKIGEIIGFYYPTKKNGMVRLFYEERGFTKIEEDENGNTVWKLEINESVEKQNKYIEIV
ncbi:MAG: HAD-IIIC family phosphatase [Lachnospiraceae bacterium]|nr:HAD-IIIC family phosphatase [Lachnospiraceae bacterium]